MESCLHCLSAESGCEVSEKPFSRADFVQDGDSQSIMSSGCRLQAECAECVRP